MLPFVHFFVRCVIQHFLGSTPQATIPRCSTAKEGATATLSRRAYVTILAWSIAIGSPLTSFGQPSFFEGFEGPLTSWRAVDSDAKYRIATHARDRQVSHSGAGSEQVQLWAGNGTFIYFAHQIGRARVIRELSAAVWVRADRPGVQLLGRVVFPRNVDPNSGQAVTTLIRGTGYTSVGKWQQLRLEDISGRLTQQVRALRSELGPEIDSREAYVDQIVLNAYGGAGQTTLWIDDLEINGLVGTRPADMPIDHLADNLRTNGNASGRLNFAASHAAGAAGVGHGAAVLRSDVAESRPSVALQGTILMASGRSVFPRIVQHRGEPLAFLRGMGFNVIQLRRLPDHATLDEAGRLGVWLIAPPPRPESLEADGFPEAMESILAWDLGSSLTDIELDATRRWAQLIRRYDPRAGRPLVAAPISEMRAYSRIADILVLGRHPLGTSLELADYVNWLAKLRQLARPGTPLWVRIQTEPDPRLRQQQQTMLGGPPSEASLDERQLRTLVRSGIASGGRGLVFDSFTRLDARTGEAGRRARALELMNGELDLIEPWISGGSVVTAASSSDSRVQSVVLQLERSKLLLPIRLDRADQFTAAESQEQPQTFTVPGVSEASEAYELSPAGLRPLVHRRVTGGIRVHQDEGNWDAIVLLTNDPLVSAGMARRITQISKRATEVKLQLFISRLNEWESVARRMQTGPAPAAETARQIVAAKEMVAASQRSLAAGDFPTAYRQIARAERLVAREQRAQWENALPEGTSPLACPLAVNRHTLPQHVALREALTFAFVAENQLPAGDFESLDAMIAAHWRHTQHPTPGLDSDLKLSTDNPRSGQTCLQIRVVPQDEAAVPQLIETAPVWVTSAAAPVQAGQLVRIHGWVRVPEPVQGSIDGLLIIDSLGGEPLAERIGQTRQWQEFTLLRAAPETGWMTVTFAMTGIGEAFLDNITIQSVRLPPNPYTAGGRRPAAADTSPDVQ